MKIQNKTLVIIIFIGLLLFLSYPRLSMAQDQNSTAQNLQPQNSTNATSEFWSISGIDFKPVNSGLTYSMNNGYGNEECLNSISGGGYTAPVHLPQGSVIQSLKFEYYNDIETPVVTTLDLHASNGWYFAASEGIMEGQGRQSNFGYGINYTPIDYDTYSLYLMWSSANSDQQLCRAVIEYIPPSIFGIALPLINK